MPRPIGLDAFAKGFGEPARRELPTRGAVCAKCGASFTQVKLPEKFLKAARGGEDYSTGYFAIDRYIPEGWVPVYCPRCDHRELSDPSGRLTVPPRTSPALELAYEHDERAALQETT